MAWSFGDSFDLYAAPADMVNGYWDSGATAATLFNTGRFTGSQALQPTSSTVLVKSSGANDAVHHLVVSYKQTAAISGTGLGTYLELFDGTTAQCSIVFKTNGDILLTSGGPAGTVLDTFTGAVAVVNTWYAFEFEVVINNTTGSWAIRKNGNPVNDYSLGSLNTRPTSTNNYANKLQVGMAATISTQVIDDLFWRSDASSVAWLGDLRCYSRMPASDQSVTWTRSGAGSIQQIPPGTFTAATTIGANSASSFYGAFIAAYDGTVSTASVVLNAGASGNLKCSVFNDASGVPGTVRSSATLLTNPITGANALTFSPFSVVKGTQYWFGFAADGTYASAYACMLNAGKIASTVGYSTFPTASPAVATGSPLVYSVTIGVAGNYTVVNEPQQDGLTSYVFDSNPGDADFYGIGSIASTPATVIATTTRA